MLNYVSVTVKVLVFFSSFLSPHLHSPSSILPSLPVLLRYEMIMMLGTREAHQTNLNNCSNTHLFILCLISSLHLIPAQLNLIWFKNNF